MPKDHEAEYRRRIREKAESDKRDRQWKHERRWQAGEIAALIAAALVGVIAVFVGNSDSARQRSVMNDQVVEMKAQRLASQAQMRGNMRWDEMFTEAPGEVAGENAWRFTPRWKNAGTTDAIDVGTMWNIRWMPASPPILLNKITCPAISEPTEQGVIIPPGGSLAQGTMSVPIPIAQLAAKWGAVIIVYGRIKYRDIFPDTPTHYQNWCDLAYPNDLSKNEWSFVHVPRQGEPD